MGVFRFLRATRLLRGIGACWFLFLAFDVGGVHECPQGHSHEVESVPAPGDNHHHHGAPAPAEPTAPSCDCLSHCCAVPAMVVATPAITDFAERVVSAHPPGRDDAGIIPTPPAHRLPFSTAPPAPHRVS